MLIPEYTNRFKKDYKRAIKRGYKISELDDIMQDLIDEKPLAEKHRDHALVGDYAGGRECHVKPDWLLVYYIFDNVITFDATGSHSDLF